MSDIVYKTKLWQALLLYLLISFLLNYTLYFIVFPSQETELKSFLIFNTTLNSLLFLLKIVVVAIMLFLAYFFYIEEKPTFTATLTAVVIAQFVYLFILAIPILVMLINRTITKEQFKIFSQINLAWLFECQNDKRLLPLFLQKITFSDILYISALWLLLKYCIEETKDRAKQIVFYFYLPFFILWEFVIAMFNYMMQA
jgi:hypothetical protein